MMLRTSPSLWALVCCCVALPSLGGWLINFVSPVDNGPMVLYAKRHRRVHGEGARLMTVQPSAFDHRISRRQLLRTVTVGSGLALLAAATTSLPALATPASQASG